MTKKFMPPAVTTGFKNVPLADSEFLSEWPLLGQWMGDSVWGDGKTRRTPSTLILTVRNGGWNVGIVNKDSDPETTLWASGPSLNDAFHCLEELLGDPSAPWHAKAEGSGNGKRKK